MNENDPGRDEGAAGRQRTAQRGSRPSLVNRLDLTTESNLFTAALFFVCRLAISLCGQFLEHRLSVPWRSRA